MTSEKLPADINADGVIDDEEKRMYIEFKRKELEDQDLMRDSQRRMAWFSLFGMLLYPFGIFLTVLFGLASAQLCLNTVFALSIASLVGVYAKKGSILLF